MVDMVWFQPPSAVIGHIINGLHNWLRPSAWNLKHRDKLLRLLIGGLEHFLFFHSVGNVIIPTDEHIFQRGRSTTNQTCLSIESLEAEQAMVDDCPSFGVPLRNLGEFSICIKQVQRKTIKRQSATYTNGCICHIIYTINSSSTFSYPPVN